MQVRALYQLWLLHMQSEHDALVAVVKPITKSKETDRGWSDIFLVILSRLMQTSSGLCTVASSRRLLPGTW